MAHARCSAISLNVVTHVEIQKLLHLNQENCHCHTFFFFPKVCSLSRLQSPVFLASFFLKSGDIEVEENNLERACLIVRTLSFKWKSWLSFLHSSKDLLHDLAFAWPIWSSICKKYIFKFMLTQLPQLI